MRVAEEGDESGREGEDGTHKALVRSKAGSERGFLLSPAASALMPNNSSVCLCRTYKGDEVRESIAGTFKTGRFGELQRRKEEEDGGRRDTGKNRLASV